MHLGAEGHGTQRGHRGDRERLELDTRRVTLEFDSDSAEDRERIARVYRHARVVSHVTTMAASPSRPTCRGASSIA